MLTGLRGGLLGSGERRPVSQPLSGGPYRVTRLHFQGSSPGGASEMTSHKMLGCEVPWGEADAPHSACGLGREVDC